MSYPTIIAGPAVITRGANTWVTEGDITVSLKRNTWSPKTSLIGDIGPRLSDQMIDISFTPVGAHDVVAKYLPYALSQIGSLLFDNTPTVIKTKAGKTITYHNSAVTKLPGFKAVPLAQLFNGNMTITSIGDTTKELTDAAAWNTFAAAAFSDASFNEQKILSPKYLAQLGPDAPLDAVESEDGFTFDFGMTFEMKKVANWGNVNAILTGLTARCSFIPVGFDEDDLWSLMGLQGADAIQPGESLSKAELELIVTGGGSSFTLHNAGPQDAAVRYGLTPLRLGEVSFVGTKTWTTGSPDPLFTVAFPA